MLLTKVILKDYGVYRGRNEFDLRCTNQKPIILIGGTNGAGKTTLFESIMLCLYGISSMGRRVTQKKYHDALEKKIHRYRGSATQADSASVLVQFKFFHDGQETEFQVDRTWYSETGRISEKLSIQKRSDENLDFLPLDTMEEQHWQRFIEEMIPRGIANLFFFDGEKIADIAEQGNEDAAIRVSFSSLLGLDMVEQLRADLQVNLTRNLSSDNKSLLQDIAKCEAEEKESLDLIERFQEKIAEKESELDRLNSDIENLESNISKIGGGFAARREESKTRLAEKTAARDMLQKRIRDMASTALPFALIPKHLDGLLDQIQKDAEIQKRQIGQDAIQGMLEDARTRIKSESFWAEMPGDTRKHIQRFLAEQAASVSAVSEECVFDFSTSQAARITNLMESAQNVSALEHDTAELMKVEEDIARIETVLVSAPTDDELGPLISKLNKMHSEKGRLEAEIEQVRSDLSSREALLRHVKIRMRDIISRQTKNEKSKVQIELTEKVQTVLDEYVKQLKIKKLNLLEQYLVDAIKILIHKKDFVQDVVVKPDTFEVELYGRDEMLMPKDTLANGEKQMLATAILWALAKTSGKPLPFVIDTPLARLDMTHRDNMIKKFFLQASHQVLVLSTDAEIGQDYYLELKPYLARSYVMKFDDSRGVTELRPGYFWEENEIEA